MQLGVGRVAPPLQLRGCGISLGDSGFAIDRQNPQVDSVGGKVDRI